MAGGSLERSLIMAMRRKIALAHLREILDYYTRLARMEAEAAAEAAKAQNPA